MQITEALVHDQLDWLDFCHVEVLAVTTDTETFNDRILIVVDLLFSCDTETHPRTIAFLVDSVETWGDTYRERLEELVRANSGRFAGDLGVLLLSHALDSGYWSIDAPPEYIVGRRLWVTDRNQKPLAVVTISDRFAYDDREVIEVEPLYTSRPLLSGMPLHPMRTPVSVSLSAPFTLQSAALVAEMQLPLPQTQLRFSTTVGAEYRYHDDAYEAVIRAGFSRRASLGALGASAKTLGTWWTNLQIAASTNLAVAILNDPPDKTH